MNNDQKQDGVRGVAWAGDLGDPAFCIAVVQKMPQEFGHIDVLLNNAGQEHPQDHLPVHGMRKQHLHDRSDAAPQQGRNRQRMSLSILIDTASTSHRAGHGDCL